MTIDTKRLRELAEKATPGPWVVEETRESSTLRFQRPYPEYTAPDGRVLSLSMGHENAEFIAATDPQTVLALLDEIDRLRTGRDLSIERTRNSFTGECFERWVTPWEPLPEEDDAL